MPNLRFPVLICRDPLGQHVVQIVGSSAQASAVGDTEKVAVDRLKDYVDWMSRTDAGIDVPSLGEPKLETFRIPVRGEHRVDGRVYPCEEVYPLTVHCVWGQQESGPFAAVLPLLGISFYYFKGDSLKELVARYVQESVKGMTPAQLQAYLPPISVELKVLTIRVKEARKEELDRPDIPELNRVAESLDDKAALRRMGRAWERDAEVEQLAKLLRGTRSNLLLVGPTGVGKSTLLATAIRHLRKPPQTKPKSDGKTEPQRTEPEEASPAGRYWLTSGHRLIAGMRYLGQWEERCAKIIDELSNIHGCLCVENLTDLIRLGGGDPSESIANFLLPYLQRSELRVVTECTPGELDASRRLLPALLDAFEIVHVHPFTPAQAVAVLDRQAAQLAHERQVQVEQGTTTQIERLFRRFQPHRAFPGGAVAFLNDLATQQSRRSRGAAKPEVTIQEAVRLFSRRTGMPELFLRDELPLTEADVLQFFEQRINGQPEACRIAADTVLTFKAGLNDPRRPLRVLLFCGPTGVGKTETAKAMADYLFGYGERRDRMLRLDLSEYGGFDAARRLLEGADGEPSALIQSVRRQPLAVVLLDEIEKAAPAVFDVLLGLLDEGRLSDRYARVTDFRSCIIILTSNLGADVRQTVGFSPRTDAPYEQAVRGYFRPEFFNRLDTVVQFLPLDEPALRRIVLRELEAIGRREGLLYRRIRFSWTHAVVEACTRLGCDNRYGARPLQRFLERTVVAPLSLLLTSQPELSSCTLEADWNSGESRIEFQPVG